MPWWEWRALPHFDRKAIRDALDVWIDELNAANEE